MRQHSNSLCQPFHCFETLENQFVYIITVSTYSTARTLFVTVKVIKKIMQPSVLEKQVPSIKLLEFKQPLNVNDELEKWLIIYM